MRAHTQHPLGQAYERGISLFKWPNVSDIWSTYLTKFIARYGGRKLERARDLFEQALDGCPPKYAKSEGGQMVLGGRGASQAQPLISNPTPCFVLPQRCTCCTRSWKKSGAWRGTPWQCMSVPPGLWSPRSSTTCSTSTSSGRLRSTGSPTPAASIRRPLRCPRWGWGVRGKKRVLQAGNLSEPVCVWQRVGLLPRGQPGVPGGVCAPPPQSQPP